MTSRHSLPLATTTLTTCWVLLATAGCGGGGGGSSSSGPPTELSYDIGSVRLTVLVDAPLNAPSVRGRVDDWTIQPPLPDGLELDPQSGVIHGRPTLLAAARSYTVTAANALGAAKCKIELGVTGAARFAYVSNRDSNTISTYTVDAHSGALGFHGHVFTPFGESGPAHMQLSPDGRFLYAAADDEVHAKLSVLAVDAADGRLTSQTPLSLGRGPTRLLFSENGRALYVTSSGSDELRAFAMDDGGQPQPLDLPFVTGDRPVDLAIAPSGQWLWVANRGGASLSAFAVDSATGALTSLGSELPLGHQPTSITISGLGEARALVTFADSPTVRVANLDESSGELLPPVDYDVGVAADRLVLHPNGRFAYLLGAHSARITILSFAPATGALASVGEAEVLTSAGELRFDAAGQTAYVLDEGRNEIAVFRVDQGSGLLTRSGAIRTQVGPTSLCLATGSLPLVEKAKHLYALNNQSGDLTSYRIKTNGDLLEVSTPALAGVDARDLVVDPHGRFLFTVDASSKLLRAYSIDPSTGAITDAWPSTTLPGKGRSLALDPEGEWLYVASRDLDGVHGYHIDPVTRSLSWVSTAYAGKNPEEVACDPTGRFLYVSIWSSDEVYAFQAQRGQIEGTPIIANAPGNPAKVRFSPAGDVALVPLITADHIATFGIDPATGALELILPGRNCDDTPTAVGVHRSGRFLYAAVQGGSKEEGHLSSFDFDASTAGISAEVQYSESVHPRDLALDPSGGFLFSADEGTSTLSVFRIDTKTGQLQYSRSVATGLSPRALAMTKTYQDEVLP